MGWRHLLVVGALLVEAAPLLDAQETAPTQARETFREAPVWESEGGVLERTLEMRRAATKLGGRKILTLTYEGIIPGPTWVVNPGDRIKLRLINDMTPPASGTKAGLETNIHVHGLQVDPRGNGDNPYLSVAPGEYFDYDIPIPADQPSGLFFYHPHRHMSAAKQFWNGLGGAIIVRGDSTRFRPSRLPRIG